MRNGLLVGMLAWGALAASMTPAYAVINFTRTSSDTTVGSTPVAVASADFNKDGKIDLAVANLDSGDVSVLFGKGDGSFLDSSASYQVSDAPAGVAVGDFNGDGKLDIVVTDEVDDTVSVLLNQDGTVFGAPLTTDVGSSPEGVVVGDFNGDGKLDVATANQLADPGTVTILLGVGDGTFLPGQDVIVGEAPTALVALDVDGDHKLDLIVTNSSGGAEANGTLTVLKGVGDGTFTAQAEIGSTSFDGPAAIATADFNGDGKADLAVANYGNGTSDTVAQTVVILLGDGTGLFQAQTPVVTVGQLPTGVVTADFNGDGKVDLATSNNFDDNVSVLIGVGNGTFEPQVTFSVAPLSSDFTDAAPAALVAADFNGDGKPDIATANEDDDAVAVLLNAGTITPPLVCAGDCDGSGDVTVNEIIVLVNIDLGSAQPSACPDGIPAGRDVDITLIIAAVNNALGACPQAA